MATRRALEKQADKRNHKQRNLRSYLLYSARDFWSRTALRRNDGQPAGCSTISGGTTGKRRSVLLGMLAQTIESRIPTVIIADGKKMPGLDGEILQLLSGVPDARLIVTSAEYKNYNFFSGWTASQIADFFANTVAGEDAAGIRTYLHQYFKLIEGVYGEVTLQTLLDADALTGGGLEAVEALEQRLGDEIDPKLWITLDYLRKTTDQRQQYDALIRRVRDSLGAFQTESVGYSIRSSLPGPGDILLIHADDAEDPGLLAEYFEQELQSIRMLPFQLIICECGDEKMTSWAKKLAASGNSVAVCTQSIYGLWGEDALTLPFQQLVFLFDDGIMPLNAERELAMLGTFEHWQVAEGGDSPPELFSFWTGTHAGLVAAAKNKVSPHDAWDCEAVLYGHKKALSKQEIALIRKLLK